MSVEYVKKEIKPVPRLPLEGKIDLTYRCNNKCRHCWLSIQADSKEREKELTFDEIKKIVDEARSMGCRKWAISGGEPMLREDFPEIFDYITANSMSYSINTNGTLITPKIAGLMKRKGTKMISIYGATSDIHDHITRTTGSFEATMEGIARLKEAGAGFIVQIVPVKDNYHQFNDMVKLAESHSKVYRIGAPWLYLSACGDIDRNKEIINQRLGPDDVVKLDKPPLTFEMEHEYECGKYEKDYLFSACIQARRDFHIDPYGGMSFCCFIKSPEFRYNLRTGSFLEGWENFIPSLGSKVKIEKEYMENCVSCELREHCRICPVYAYLEHGRFSAKVEYLCEVAKENKKFKETLVKNHRRFYESGGITIQVDSEIPFTEDTFEQKFKKFQVEGPGEDTIKIRHYFSLPELEGNDPGKEVYRKAPWTIYKKDSSWIYLGIDDEKIHQVAVFNNDHTSSVIYSRDKDMFLKGNLHSLTTFPTDQILLARVLAYKEGFYLHSGGVIMDGKGLLFAGHSEAGKSTMMKMLRDRAEILCDDRNIIRKNGRDFIVYGTWSHGEIPDVSSASAPLKAIFFLRKSDYNRVVPIQDKKEIARNLVACLIRPFVTTDWWEKTLSILEEVTDVLPCYDLYFDKSGDVVDILKSYI
jgi:radical SAM protein with 4Fe4S-binding SPASM domain